MKRVVFHSITKQEVLNAIQNPIEINLPLVNAQQTRRILDRLVGYKLSPILQRKIKKAKKDGKKGLSAGRVQSVALKLVVLREEERDRFESIEHYQIQAQFKTGNDQTFDTRLQQIGTDKIIPTPKKKVMCVLRPNRMPIQLLRIFNLNSTKSVMLSGNITNGIPFPHLQRRLCNKKPADTLVSTLHAPCVLHSHCTKVCS